MGRKPTRQVAGAVVVHGLRPAGQAGCDGAGAGRDGHLRDTPVAVALAEDEAVRGAIRMAGGQLGAQCLCFGTLHGDRIRTGQRIEKPWATALRQIAFQRRYNLAD